MKKIAYFLIKQIIRLGCFCYFKNIEFNSLDAIPPNKPVLMLANHQNALLDALLIAISGKRKPYFLTRADVFKNRPITAFLTLLRMVPIYRIRDGRDVLGRNSLTFDRCAGLLERNEAILIFPEGNHSLERRIRPLSKGFTRILARTLELHPQLDIRLVPVGINYMNAAAFPDKAALFFGKDIPIQEVHTAKTRHAYLRSMKERVANELKKLTTHIDDAESYESILKNLDRLGANYLEPQKVNQWIKKMPSTKLNGISQGGKGISLLKAGFFNILNFPLLLIWRAIVKKTVPEPEFMSTYRFLYALMAFPIYYIFIVLIFWNIMGLAAAFGIVAGLFLFNLMYVKR